MGRMMSKTHCVTHVTSAALSGIMAERGATKGNTANAPKVSANYHSSRSIMPWIWNEREELF